MAETKKYFSKFSDGTNTYEVKDAEARTALEGKQNSLTAGTNITLENDTVATTAAKVTIKDWSTSTPTQTDLNQFIINKLTKAQYDDIQTPDPNQFYMVTDDTGITVDSSLSTSSENPVQNKVITTALNGKADSSSLAAVATSGSYNDLDNKPTIPTVNNATLTIQRNGTTVNTFTANASENVTADISVPTTVAELSDAGNYVLSSALATVATSGSYNDLADKPTIPTVDQTYSRKSTNAQSGVAVASAIKSAIASVYKPGGSSAFADLPPLTEAFEGYVLNITDAFTTTEDFVEGAGKDYPAGTNIVCVSTRTGYKWDVLAGMVDLSGYQLANTAVTHTASTAIGSATQPVYVDASGVATALTYELNKTVPADAVFTDTTYEVFTGATSSADGASGLVKAPVAGDQEKFLRGDGNWATVATTDTKNTAGATDTSSKIFLVGATTQDDNPQTYTHDTAFVDDNGRLNSAAPASDANDNTVATTKWVKDQGYKTSSGVTSVAEGSVNGTIAVSVDGGNATNVAVHGLGSAAYTDSTAYATANHTHQWTYDSDTETLTFGSAI